MKTSTVTITPDKARALLERNTLNRRANRRNVARYANDMRAGRWRLNGEAVKLSTNGRLLDGQHRLMACIEADTPFDTLLVEGLEPEAQMTMDQGVKRTIGNQFRLMGITHYTTKAAVLRHIWYWRRGVPLGQAGPVAPSLDDLLAEMEQWSELDAACSLGERMYRETSWGVKRSTYATWALLALTLDDVAATTFAHAVQTGEMLAAGDPALTLRKHLISFAGSRRTLGRADQLAWLWRGFMDHRDGKKRSMFKRGRPLGDLPEVGIVRAGGEQ